MVKFWLNTVINSSLKTLVLSPQTAVITQEAHSAPRTIWRLCTIRCSLKYGHKTGLMECTSRTLRRVKCRMFGLQPTSNVKYSLPNTYASQTSKIHKPKEFWKRNHRQHSTENSELLADNQTFNVSDIVALMDNETFLLFQTQTISCSNYQRDFITK